MLQIKDNCFFKKITLLVLKEVFASPNKVFHIRGLSKITELSTTAVTKTVEELVKLGLLTSKNGEVVREIRANLESIEYSHYKRIFNLYSIEKTGLIDCIRKELSPSVIVLFGSFSRGEDVENSDVDIFVMCKNENILFSCKIFENFVKRNINLHALKSLDGTSKEFRNTLANGIVIYGYLKVI